MDTAKHTTIGSAVLTRGVSTSQCCEPGSAEPSAYDYVYRGHGLACIREARDHGRPRDRYALVRLTDVVTMGALRWSGQACGYVLVPAPQTLWASGVLSEIGVWLRRLNRQPSSHRRD